MTGTAILHLKQTEEIRLRRKEHEFTIRLIFGPMMATLSLAHQMTLLIGCVCPIIVAVNKWTIHNFDTNFFVNK